MEIAIVLSLLGLAILFFALESISVDLITLILLLALVMSGILTPAEAFAGFSNEIIVILGSIFVISAALQETGVLDALGGCIMKIAAGSKNRLRVSLIVLPAAISAFMNNTTVTAMFVPPVIGLARRAKVSPSLLLMPLAFASILGGTCTLIGTSTNVAVSGYIRKVGLEPVGLFELAPIGLVLVVVGGLYLITIGRHLLPDHEGQNLTSDYLIRDYLSEILILPDSPLIGQQTRDSDLNVLDFRILRLMRGESKHDPNSNLRICEGDTLLVTGKAETLMKVKKIEGIDIKPDRTLANLSGEDTQIAEVLLEPRNQLLRRTLRETDFRRHFGATVLAIYRQGRTLRDAIGDVRLQAGDLLLIEATRERLTALDRVTGFSLLEEISPALYQKRYGFYVILTFLAALVVGGFGWLPLSIAFLAAAVAILLLRCITMEKAYAQIDWRLLILIGGMTAFGTAMEKTGAAEFLAGGIVSWLEPFGVMAILSGFFVLTILLTQPMSNAAAALVVLPIALSTAAQLEVSQRTFAIAVMLAGSISFITPFEPSCILVYGPGKYRFRDFVKVGSGLTLILSIVILLLLPRLWPLK